MKKIISILTIVLLLTSCSSDVVMPQDELVGKWKWIQSSGGIDGRTETPETEGYEQSIEFTSKSIKRYRDGQLLTENTYTIILDNSILSQEKVEIIVYENEWKQSYSTDGNFLYLVDECLDCFASKYSRE